MTNGMSLRPRLVVADAAKAIDFYVRALGAHEVERFSHDGKIVHAELVLGAIRLDVKDADQVDPAPSGPAPVILSLQVPDVDTTARRMVEAGATVVFPVTDHDYGRMGRLADPFGHVWIIAEAGPPEPDLWTLIDLQTPWCVHAVATLGIPALLADGPRDVTELASAAGCDPVALHQVLGHLTGKELFEQAGPGRFGLGPAGRALLGPAAAFLDLDGIGGRMAQAWSTLPGYLRTGRPGYAEVFGMPFWQDLAEHPAVGASFDELMGPAGHGAPDPRIELSGGWDGVRQVIDVGGGTGTLLAAVLQEHPGVRGTLVDLPGTVARSGPVLAPVADRVELSGQSFFDPLPAGADLYLLAKVLNDWPDAQTVAILRRCAEAAGPDGRILVLGGVSPDQEPPRLVIEMLLLGGRSDGLARFTELAAQAGLAVLAAGPQPSGRYAVELRAG